MKKLILGSQSPRRFEILNFFSVPFEQIAPDFDETQVSFCGNPAAFVREVAERKALCLASRYPKDIILTADTVVYRNGRLFMKPETLDEAAGMLSELSGKEHSVFTGVCAISPAGHFIESEESKVYFHPLTPAQIRAYHSTFNPLDKAGAYAIQKGGCVIVKRIEGCYYNIMGLPLNATRSLLLKAGVDLWNFLKT